MKEKRSSELPIKANNCPVIKHIKNSSNSGDCGFRSSIIYSIYTVLAMFAYPGTYSIHSNSQAKSTQSESLDSARLSEYNLLTHNFG